MSNSRIERDSMGELQVPAEALYGAQTQRAVNNFPMVVYDDSKAKGTTLGSINAGIIGRNAALPDSYGYSPEELVTLLNGWRERALSKK